jgi:hypothetical protein
MTHNMYLAVILSALTVLVLGCWNPTPLQTVQHGKPTGQPNYMWLALLSLLVGLLTCYLVAMKKGKGKGYLSLD